MISKCVLSGIAGGWGGGGRGRGGNEANNQSLKVTKLLEVEFSSKAFFSKGKATLVSYCC